MSNAVMPASLGVERQWMGSVSRVLKVISLGLVGWVASMQALAATLQDIAFASLPGDRMEIRLKLDAAPDAIKDWATQSPARIAVDLAGVKNGLEQKYHNLGTGNVRSAMVVEAGDRTRLVVTLTELAGYEARAEGQEVVVVIGDVGVVAPQADAASGQSSAPVGGQPLGDPLPVQAGSGIRDIDFRRGSNGEGQVHIRLSDRSLGADLAESAGKIRIEFPDATLPEKLNRRLDVRDFATPVQFVDALVEGGNPVVYMEANGLYDYLAYQADESFIVEFKPLTQAEARELQAEKFQFTGDKLSLNFQDIEVRSVLQLIADFTGLNMVASDTVSGNITLRLQNVPWDQALDLVLKTKGLDKRQVGNVMMVGPAAEIAERERIELENAQQAQELAPLITEFVPIRYAKASDIAALLGGDQGLMSDRGSVSVDSRTNTLLIQDTAEKIENVRRALKVLDVAVRQVMVEARIVEASTDFAESLGVKWGAFGNNAELFGKTGASVGGSLSTVEAIRGVDPVGLAATGNAFTDGSDTFVDLAAPGNASTIALGLFRDNGLLELELSALESSGRGEVVSQPKVITADRSTASIQSGTQIPFQEASSSGATSTSFIDAVTKLEVTPQITPDGHIILDLTINKDSPDAATGGIDTNEITTQVVVGNGETVVLGGILTDNQSHRIDKTPFFGDIPYLGRLFRRNIDASDKAELLIFITPRLLDETLTGY